MTLIIAHFRKGEWLMVADRRLTGDGEIRDEASNKATFIQGLGGRFATVYTGLATVGSWDTQWFLESAVQKLVNESFENGTIQLSALISQAFSRHPDIVKTADRLIESTVLLLGYSNSGEPRSGKIYIRRDNGSIQAEPVTNITRDGYVTVIGASQWVAQERREMIRSLPVDMPNDEVLKRMVDELRTAAKLAEAVAGASGSHGTIGMDVSTMAIPINGTVRSSAYSFSGPKIFGPTVVDSNMIMSGFVAKPYADPTVGTPEWSKKIKDMVKARNGLEAFISSLK